MVVFEASIWDRLDACAGAILALVMCDRGGFAAMVNGILEQLKPEVRKQAHRPIMCHLELCPSCSYLGS